MNNRFHATSLCRHHPFGFVFTVLVGLGCPSLRARASLLPLGCALALALGAGAAPTPEWIWHDNGGAAPGEREVRYFRKAFRVEAPVSKAVLVVACDNAANVFLNGESAANNRSWEQPSRATVTDRIRLGDNLLAVRARNEGSAAGLIARLDLTLEGGRTQTIVTDPTWLSAATEQEGWQQPGFAAAGWTKVVSLGKLGVQPWGDVFAPKQATPAESLTVLPGFKVELLHSATPEEGSWVAMTFDPKGRLVISPQFAERTEEAGLLRVTFDSAGRIAKKEWIAQPMYEAQGLLFAHNSLYVVVNRYRGPFESGLYRLVDTDGDDQFDQRTLLKAFAGGGEHGPHAVVAGPDGMLYVMNGNHTKVPDGLAPTSPHKNYAEDFLLPRQWDGNGHATGILAPGGHILRTDPEGKHWELLLAGFRNAYDFDFNEDGEIFTYDSDMEWDWGMPWYRPTRVNHCVSGGEYGWRSGTAKWPEYYPDSLPATVNIGIGSPTGVRFGTKSRFPEKYRKAFYILDWSYGRILAVHLTPKGASYSGTFETFLKGKPLNLTDLDFGPDGAMYFTTGGRGTQSGLYRVTALPADTAQASSSPSPGADLALAARQADHAAEARALRRRLEAFHGRQDPKAVEFAWPYLDHPDRWIRYAARIAIESQPVEQWQGRALAETRLQASLTALLAMARCANPAWQTDVLEALGRLPVSQMSEAQMLEALRVLSLVFIRMGRPTQDVADEVIRALDPLYPAKSERLNRELSQLLIYLEAPGVVERTLALMDAAPTQEEQIHYLFHLRTLKRGWTLDQRRHYFSWFNQSRAALLHPPELVKWFRDVERDYVDGASFPRFIANFRREAVASLSETEQTALADLLAEQIPAAHPAAPPRTFVKDWQMEDVLPLLDRVSTGRNFEKGKAAYAAAQCFACHRFGNEGGSVGPELTAVASKYSRRDILESILQPSKVVSDQYQYTTVILKNGDDVTGRLVDETDDKLVLQTNPLTTEDQTVVRKADVAARRPSTLSPMPEGLLSVLTEEEILDLLAYLESGGRKEHAAFRP